MVYLDTSILVPLFVPEDASQTIRNWFAKQSQAELTISEWTCTEFVSAIGIKVRIGDLDQAAATTVIQLFRQVVEDSLTVLIPTRADFLLASDYLTEFNLGLRAGDALHVAIARNHEARLLYSRDRRLVDGANKLNIRSKFLRT
jgi:uncharacterized protein